MFRPINIYVVLSVQERPERGEVALREHRHRDSLMICAIFSAITLLSPTPSISLVMPLPYACMVYGGVEPVSGRHPAPPVMEYHSY